jgi:HAD superfamily hydrolase (TIGR01549 family)
MNVINDIKAIGFDLFNTLIMIEPQAVQEALNRLIASLVQSGFTLDPEPFKHAHREAARRFLEETRESGRETHNRFWISAALETHGYTVPPDDTRIAEAVEAYFSPFLEFCHLIPGTREILETLKGKYRLALLSNFTHPPAAIELLNGVGITSFFDVLLISGDLGYRKPHPLVFGRLTEDLGLEKSEILFVGDDPELDVDGAQRAGLQPIWMTYVIDQKIPSARSVLSGGMERPNFEVPRISRWEELLSLLDNR